VKASEVGRKLEGHGRRLSDGYISGKKKVCRRRKAYKFI